MFTFPINNGGQPVYLVFPKLSVDDGQRVDHWPHIIFKSAKSQNSLKISIRTANRGQVNRLTLRLLPPAKKSDVTSDNDFLNAISSSLSIPVDEVAKHFIRLSGPGSYGTCMRAVKVNAGGTIMKFRLFQTYTPRRSSKLPNPVLTYQASADKERYPNLDSYLSNSPRKITKKEDRGSPFFGPASPRPNQNEFDLLKLVENL